MADDSEIRMVVESEQLLYLPPPSLSPIHSGWWITPCALAPQSIRLGFCQAASLDTLRQEIQLWGQKLRSHSTGRVWLCKSKQIQSGIKERQKHYHSDILTPTWVEGQSCLWTTHRKPIEWSTLDKKCRGVHTLILNLKGWQLHATHISPLLEVHTIYLTPHYQTRICPTLATLSTLPALVENMKIHKRGNIWTPSNHTQCGVLDGCVAQHKITSATIECVLQVDAVNKAALQALQQQMTPWNLWDGQTLKMRYKSTSTAIWHRGQQVPHTSNWGRCSLVVEMIGGYVGRESSPPIMLRDVVIHS